MGNMKAAKAAIHKYYAELTVVLKSYVDITEFVKLYMKTIDDMNAEQFDKFIVDLENMDTFLEVLIPVSTGTRFPEEEIIALTRKYGGEPFTQLRIVDDTTGEVFITPEKYWVPLFPKRRQIQTMESKISLPDSNMVRDNLTGAVTGAAKGSSMSSVQSLSMIARGCVASALEFNKGRGGDLAASREFNRALIADGSVSLNSLLKTGSRPESTDTLAIRWTCIHLAHNM